MGDSTVPLSIRIDHIDPYEFEELVAKIWENRGWQTSVTGGSQDRGIDVIARQEKPIQLKVLIQAKAYSLSNKIGSEEVRKYATLYDQEPNVDTIAIVTTGTFTKHAETLADDLEIRLVDRPILLQLLRSLDSQSLISSLSPIDTQTYELEGIPTKSATKDNCPKCSTSDSMWEAHIEDGTQILVCEECETTWKTTPSGGWRVD